MNDTAAARDVAYAPAHGVSMREAFWTWMRVAALSDGVHWAEQYMRDGTYKAYHLGKPSKGKWYAKDGELCLEDGKAEPDCREVWSSSNKIEFRGTGLEGILQAQQKRG
jgi:hypothetical protein